MIQSGALGAAMSGSGPTVFGIFDQEALARQAQQVLAEDREAVFLAQPLTAPPVPVPEPAQKQG